MQHYGVTRDGKDCQRLTGILARVVYKTIAANQINLTTSNKGSGQLQTLIFAPGSQWGLALSQNRTSKKACRCIDNGKWWTPEISFRFSMSSLPSFTIKILKFWHCCWLSSKWKKFRVGFHVNGHWAVVVSGGWRGALKSTCRKFLNPQKYPALRYDSGEM